MKGQKFYPRSITMVTVLLGGLALGIWLASMYCLTSVTAEYAAARYLDDHRDRASQIARYSYVEWLDRDYSKYENYKENRFWEAVSPKNFGSGNPVVGGTDGFLKRRSDSEEYFAATALYDAAGNCLERSWTDFFYFEYLTEEQWADNEERSGDNARAFFDREKLTDAGRELVDQSSTTFKAEAMRFTGTFDGVEFTSTRIEYIDYDEFRNALHQKGSGSYTVPGVVKAYDLQWITAYEDPEAVPAGAEIITLYSDWFAVCFTENSPAFSYAGEKYNNVAELVDEVGPSYVDGHQNLTRYEGLDLLILSVDYCHTYDGETYYDSSYYGTAAYQGEAPEMHFYLVSAVWCSPWRTAFAELRNVYIVTFLLALALVLWVRSVIRNQLIRPAQLVEEAMLKERSRLDKRGNEEWYWRESRALEQWFGESNDRLRMRQNEITRLNTALDYAKDAESNRRQMTSNIAHELKTPLAVIHSYAEGLKEQIAEDKRDRYLDVILSESERMDRLVLEMLDLSRLEAGRVKLARDEFSLTELVCAVFEKLEMAIQAKGLQVEYDIPADCMVTADESRIGQVIENFATNAVKYTPVGGKVRVRIVVGQRMTMFAVENDSEPLSSEVLAKVWDTFYRADGSRSSAGTGLGLAIAKSIVELHGGKCAARNTKNGVEFSFTI